jgi:hypothetical protein
MPERALVALDELVVEELRNAQKCGSAAWCS